MKKTFLLCLLLAFFACLFADLMQPVEKDAAYDNVRRTPLVLSNSNRDIPEWSFSIDPVSLITNYYDYPINSAYVIPFDRTHAFSNLSNN